MAAATCGAGALVASSSGLEGLRPRSSEVPERVASRRCVVVRAAGKDGNGKGKGKEEEEKKSLFTSLTDALDFAAVRSEKDAELLQDARQATKAGDRMSREQYGALRRKIGGTYKDFFKDSVEGEDCELRRALIVRVCTRISKSQLTI
ncbi:hypothetical protein M758_11G121500 [Ceratodon purpureus]|nr:hypothetical protein M758_11G121500 [Ceratodon purpureus]